MIKETDFTADMVVMYETMSNISEANCCAGWITGNEVIIWEDMHSEYSLDTWLGQMLARLQKLSDKLCGWIIWLDDQDEPTLPTDDWGPYFVSLEEWLAIYQNRWQRHSGE